MPLNRVFVNVHLILGLPVLKSQIKGLRSVMVFPLIAVIMLTCVICRLPPVVLTTTFGSSSRSISIISLTARPLLLETEIVVESLAPPPTILMPEGLLDPLPRLTVLQPCSTV